MSHEIGTETPSETLAQFRAAFEYVAQYFTDQKTKRRGRRTPRQAARWQQIAATLPKQEPQKVVHRRKRDPFMEMLNAVMVPQSGMYEISVGEESA